MARIDKISKNNVINKDEEIRIAEEYRKKLKTKCPSIEQNVG